MPVAEVAADVHAAGFGLEQAYVSLFVDAGCLVDDVASARLVNAYVTGLQEDLATLGYYTTTVDGVYGPDTVAAVVELQRSAGLPETGVVDPATEAALGQQLADKGEQDSLNIAALQGALAGAGFYDGPIDGTWTPSSSRRSWRTRPPRTSAHRSDRRGHPHGAPAQEPGRRLVPDHDGSCRRHDAHL